MLFWIFTLEFGNDEGIRSFKNIRKILLVYVLPNISAILIATALSVQLFYDPKSGLIFILMLDVIVVFLLHYIAQRNLLSNLKNEVLIKFIPTKVSQFIKLRLFFFFIKFFLPIIIFNFIFISFYIEKNYLILIILMISMIIIINLQVYVSVIIRYCINRMRRFPLKILQVSLFLVFVGYSALFIFTNTERLLYILEGFLENAKYAHYTVNSLYIIGIATIISVTLLVLKVILNQLNLNHLIHNRNLSFDVNTGLLEWIHKKTYGINLSKVQMLLFEKDIKCVIRNSKVFLFLLSLVHLVILGTMTFFFLALNDLNETGIFMSKLYLVFTICQITFMGILSIPNKEFTDFKKDFKVLNNYHIKLSDTKMVIVKTRLLEAFIFPKIFIIYVTYIITVLILGEYTLALVYLINYLHCFFLVKTFSLWLVKRENKLNNKNRFLGYINIGLIVVFLILLTQVLDSTMQYFMLLQVLLLGILIVQYCFHLFVFKDFKKMKAN